MAAGKSIADLVREMEEAIKTREVDVAKQETALGELRKNLESERQRQDQEKAAFAEQRLRIAFGEKENHAH